MRLFTATVFCTACQRKIRGEPMSNKEDADLFMRSDHMATKGHWPDDEDSYIHEIQENEQPVFVGKNPKLADKTPVPSLDDKPRSLKSNRKYRE